MVAKHNRYGTVQMVKAVCMVLFVLFATACRVTRHIPEDKEVVSKVHIIVDGQPSTNNSLKMAVQQKAYHRTFGFLPVSTWMWHNDTSKRFHRWRNKIGTEPQVYDEERTLTTERSMKRALNAQGYLYAKVSHKVKSKNRKATVTYIIDRGLPKILNSVKYMVEDPSLDSLVSASNIESSLQKDALLDRDMLDNERTRLTDLLRDNGYWDFNKDDISFIADTLQGHQEVDLTVFVSGLHEPYVFNKVHFNSDFDILNNGTSDSLSHFREMAEGYDLTYKGDRCYLKDYTLISNCHIVPGKTDRKSVV